SHWTETGRVVDDGFQRLGAFVQQEDLALGVVTRSIDVQRLIGHLVVPFRSKSGIDGLTILARMAHSVEAPTVVTARRVARRSGRPRASRLRSPRDRPRSNPAEVTAQRPACRHPLSLGRPQPDSRASAAWVGKAA